MGTYNSILETLQGTLDHQTPCNSYEYTYLHNFQGTVLSNRETFWNREFTVYLYKLKQLYIVTMFAIFSAEMVFICLLVGVCRHSRYISITYMEGRVSPASTKAVFTNFHDHVPSEQGGHGTCVHQGGQSTSLQKSFTR